MNKPKMKILIACEESQAVCIEFRKLGHEAFSCDIEPCSGGHPEWHILGCALKSANPKGKRLDLESGGCLFFDKNDWDMIIVFPPCTYLTNTGNRWFNIEKYGDKAIKRHRDRKEAIKFFMTFVNLDCGKIAIENPIGVMSTRYQKPNQVIHPWMFGHKTTKGTCLWLKGLTNIKPTDIVEKGEVVTSKSGNRMSKWYYDTSCLPLKERAKARSKTFIGIAKAMANQWG